LAHCGRRTLKRLAVSCRIVVSLAFQPCGRLSRRGGRMAQCSAATPSTGLRLLASKNRPEPRVQQIDGVAARFLLSGYP